MYISPGILTALTEKLSFPPITIGFDGRQPKRLGSVNDPTIASVLKKNLNIASGLKENL